MDQGIRTLQTTWSRITVHQNDGGYKDVRSDYTTRLPLFILSPRQLWTFGYFHWYEVSTINIDLFPSGIVFDVMILDLEYDFWGWSFESQRVLDHKTQPVDFTVMVASYTRQTTMLHYAVLSKTHDMFYQCHPSNTNIK